MSLHSKWIPRNSLSWASSDAATREGETPMTRGQVSYWDGNSWYKVWFGMVASQVPDALLRTKPTQGSASFPSSVSSTFWSFHAWTSINLLTRNGLWQLYFRQLFLQPFQIACEELHFSISFFPYVFLPVDIKTKYFCCLIAYYISSEKQCWPFPTFLCIFPLDSCIPCPWMARCSPARGTSLLPMWPPWESSDSLPPDAAPTTRPPMALARTCR